MHATTGFFRLNCLLTTTFAWRSLTTTWGTRIIQPSRPRGRNHSQCCCVAFIGAVIVIATTSSSFSHACACHVYIHVCMYVYLPKFNEQMHYYYDPNRSTIGIFSQQHCDLFWEIIWRQFGSNVLPSFILSTSPYIKIRTITGEYCSNHQILHATRLDGGHRTKWFDWKMLQHCPLSHTSSLDSVAQRVVLLHIHALNYQKNIHNVVSVDAWKRQIWRRWELH